MRVRPHHHKCQTCGAKTECGGTWEQNYDGFPEVICPEFHLSNGDINADFICECCYEKQQDDAAIQQQNEDTLARHLNETLMQNTVPAIRP